MDMTHAMKVGLWQRVRIALRSEQWAMGALIELPTFCEFSGQPSCTQFTENGMPTENCVEREVFVTAGRQGRVALRIYAYANSEHKRFAAHIVGS